MLVVLALISLPPCPLGVTAHPLPAEAGYAFKVEKSAVGRAPTTPCIDLDRHLAVPRITFKVDHPTQLRPESGPILDGIADWLHAVPNAALRVHSVYGVERIPDTQPHLRRGRAVVDYLVGRGITPDRLSVAGTDVIVRGNTPSARARRRAMAGFWFERRPYTPSTATDCKAVCED
jgi:outer membrane protein OmpA-like peptidoglycan-associated protein